MYIYPEELAQAGIVGLAWLSLRILQVLCEPEAQDFQHAIDGVVGGANSYECIGRIDVVPVLEVGRRL